MCIIIRFNANDISKFQPYFVVFLSISLLRHFCTVFGPIPFSVCTLMNENKRERLPFQDKKKVIIDFYLFSRDIL